MDKILKNITNNWFESLYISRRHARSIRFLRQLVQHSK